MCITTEWIEKAEILWMNAVQEELGSQSPTWKTQLGCFIDGKGLLRCKGRLKNAPLPYSTHFPLLIPRSHNISVLLIRRAHEQVFHNGVKETLTQLRAQYWIPKGRTQVKQIIHKCVLCKAHHMPHHHHHHCHHIEWRKFHHSPSQVWRTTHGQN